MKLAFLLAISLTFMLSNLARAQDGGVNLCINDKDGHKGASSQIVNIAIRDAKDPLARAFQDYQMHLCDPNVSDSPLTVGKAFAAIGEFASSLTKPATTFIKKECIEASLQRDINQKGYVCKGERPKEFSNTGENSTPCLNQYSVDYIHFSVNLALKCFSSIRDPIDARFILRKINGESGFNFFLSSGGGTGIGQSTSYPVRDIAGQKKNEGNARSILEDLAASKDPACKPFQSVVKSDLETPPPIPPAKNVCDYVSTNEGFARALIYGLGYYVYNREEYIKNYVRKNRLPKEFLIDKQFINYATLLAYGPGGPNGAIDFLDSIRVKKIGPTAATDKIKAAGYVRESDEFFEKELLRFLKGNSEEPTRNEKRGDTCVTN
ncbi:hypothetical protein [Bdellovibrio sp. HCB2-146]|uniref:hypothetical protein n=1 Tax=Bdellovibrio sp. HCB2-146 TaxID=3394362 RepID=UPI0039BD7BD4